MLRETLTNSENASGFGGYLYDSHHEDLRDLRTTVTELLTSASSCLARDRLAAKKCIDRAAALLRSLPAAEADEVPARTPLARGGLAPWQVKRIKAHVTDNLSSTIVLDDMARLCRLSASHFGRAFKVSFGEPPHGFLVRQRVDRAKQMMLETGEPLCQIAFACGFADQSHFSRLFRRWEGISPNAWRRAHAKQSGASRQADGIETRTTRTRSRRSADPVQPAVHG